MTSCLPRLRGFLTYMMCALTLATLLTLTACGTNPAGSGAGNHQGPRGEITTIHVHQYGEWSTTVTPTCSSTGERVRTCACGATETGILGSTGHVPEPAPAADPTCTEDGYTEALRCADCHQLLSVQKSVAALGHDVVTDPGIPATCSENGLSLSSHCLRCGEILIQQTTLPAIGHTTITDPAVPATCIQQGLTEGCHCALCGEVLKAQSPLPMSDHTPVPIEAIPATCTQAGRTAGVECAHCHATLTAPEPIAQLSHVIENNVCRLCGALDFDYSDPSHYHTHYGYDFLGTLARGETYQAFYRRLDETALAFHTGKETIKTTPGTDLARLPKISYADLDMTFDEVNYVYSYFTCDRPLYYWLENQVIYNDQQGIFIMHANAEYADGEARDYYNGLIYQTVEHYAALTEGVTSAYEIALIYHDALIAAVDYAFESDGRTPETDLYAYRITGIFQELGAVCESYTRTFQLLLNLHDIENIFVKGMAGERHSWNLVRLEDGEWYWCDLTWDDLGEDYLGVAYRYFCVSESQSVLWWDAREGKTTPTRRSGTFLDSHTPFDLSNEKTWDRMYDLPIRAGTAFSSESVLELGEQFEADGLTYARMGADTVSLVSADVTGEVTVPETVRCGGRSYTVTALYAQDAQGYFVSNRSVFGDDVTAVTLPKTITAISAKAFAGCTGLEQVTLPSSVQVIGAQAFADCRKLKEIRYGGTAAQWENVVLGSGWNSRSGVEVVFAD